MFKTLTFSRNTLMAALIISLCGVIGVGWGWVDMSASLKASEQAAMSGDASQAIAFVLPASPPDLIELNDTGVDPHILRLWELTARQPLPPRKEPLTPPNWKIVGVTASGNEKTVLLLFENQTATEPRKVGENLPGGAKIVQISQDELRISLNGQLMKLNLRKQ